MQVNFFGKPELKHNPYEEDCIGAHRGEKIEIKCDGELKIVVSELVTGIGNSYLIHGEYEGHKTKRFSIFVDDDGELNLAEIK